MRQLSFLSKAGWIILEMAHNDVGVGVHTTCRVQVDADIGCADDRGVERNRLQEVEEGGGGHCHSSKEWGLYG